MKLTGVLRNAVFIRRINRFLGLIKIDGNYEHCHIRDPGMLTELLIPNAKILVKSTDIKKRKTRFELIAVDKNGLRVVVNSGLHNKLAEEILRMKIIPELANYEIKAKEWKFGKSRIDFLLSNDHKKYLLEVKGCTLVEEKIALFPDAATKRGQKHLKELTSSLHEGFNAGILFLIMRKDAKSFSANFKTDPEFANLFKKAITSGVQAFSYSFDFDGADIRVFSRVPVNIFA